MTDVERALSIRQPWADLVLLRGKDVENRTWPVPSTVDLPLRIAVHASQRLDRDIDGAMDIYKAAHDSLDGSIVVLTPAARRGALLGFVTVTGCHHARDCTDVARWCWTDEKQDRVYVEHTGGCSPWAEPGDVYHWTLADPDPMAVPVPMRGALGLWRLPANWSKRPG